MNIKPSITCDITDYVKDSQSTIEANGALVRMYLKEPSGANASMVFLKVRILSICRSLCGE